MAAELIESSKYSNLLSKKFLAGYGDKPEHMNELGQFVFYRTYSRWLPDEGRRETWKEAAARAVQYNVWLEAKELKKKKIKFSYKRLTQEAEVLFDNVFNLRQFLSGRTHWVGGAETGVANKFPLANFNCSFVSINSWDDIGDLFYLLLVGTGVGFKATKKMASKLAPIRKDIEIVHAEYVPLPKDERIEFTDLHDLGNGYAKMFVGDSKEGWVEALRWYFKIHTLDEYKHIHTLKISYNSVRPIGERLVTFGGTASGHEPLKEMFQGIHDVFSGKYAPVEELGNGYVGVRPIHILDIGNLVGNNVVVGGVRRTAEIFLCDADDWEVILAKYGINGIWSDGHMEGDKWIVDKPAEEKHKEVMDALAKVIEVPQWMKDLKMNDKEARPLHHRRMSNNSIGFEKKPRRKMLKLIFTVMKYEGEPGFVNLQAAGKRRYNAEGLNPCAEILLDTYGVCNLTTVNVDAFVFWNEDIKAYDIDLVGLLRAQKLSARAGVRMTCLDLEIPHWDAVHKRDRLIGTSLTGWRDAMEKLGWNDEQEAKVLQLLSRTSSVEAASYATELRIPIPLLDNTVKPEGTLSQVAGGVSSGVHASHAPYYIRRIRINAHDPLAKVAMELGWTVNPEVGQTWLDAKTLVIDFPVASGASRTKDDVYIDEQFDRYFRFQENYTAHNTSNTIHVRDNEWGRAEEIVWNRWDDFIGVSFLSYDNHSYELAPYETITKEKYEEMVATMKPFDPKRLDRWETNGISELTDESCADGACAPR
jgi:ribonucleoside-triphosphate reductase